MSFSPLGFVQRFGLSPSARAGLVLTLMLGVGLPTGAGYEARAQALDEAACADTLDTAERAYRNRDYRRAVSLASQCTDQAEVGDDTAVRAYRLITLASLRQGALVQARSAVAKILRIDPGYTADPVNDPPSYDLFVSMVREDVEPQTTAEAEPTAPDAEAPEASGAPPPTRTPAPFFVKPFGIGISDYTGDMPGQNVSHPFDFQEFSRGEGVPFLVHTELGYQFAPQWGLVLGVRVGNYPVVGYNTGTNDISDTWRYTPQLMVRYTFAPVGEAVAVYLDGGVNVTFGGEGTATTSGGPLLGAGVDVPLSDRLSFYVESRFGITFPDEGIDGSDVDASGPGTSFDMANQLLGVGLRIRFGGS